MDRSVKAHRALLHPLWLAALALLALNDHVLKGSGLLPGWLTGKLSDFAGLIVAPSLLAVLLRSSSRRALVAAHVAPGAVFAAIKIVPAAALAFERLTALTPFPWQITVDPTDLVALPALLVSWRVLVPVMSRPSLERLMAQRALAIAGALACAATSQRNICAEDPNACGNGIPREQAALVIGNTTDAERLVRVRPLKDSVVTDCGKMLVDPTDMLARDLFAPAETWLIQPGRGLPLGNRTDCSAYLIDADGLSMTLVAWSQFDFPTEFLSTSTFSPDEGRMIGLQLNTTTGKLELGTHPAVHAAPPLEPPAPAPACAVPDAGVGIEWSEPVPSGGAITALESSPDGCHAFTLNDGGSDAVFYLCVPADAMPFKVGDSIQIESLPFLSGAFPETGGQGVVGNGLILRSVTHEVIVIRGNVIARHSMSSTAEPLTEPSVGGETAAGCLGSHDECGSLVIPLEASFTGDHVPNNIGFLRAGANLALADGYGTLHLIRAEEMPIRDTECPPVGSETRYYESVLVVPLVVVP